MKKNLQLHILRYRQIFFDFINYQHRYTFNKIEANLSNILVAMKRNCYRTCGTTKVNSLNFKSNLDSLLY